ncbi:MAG TPA: LysR substrate-binding domain-containing protein [Azospirillaceae bacterium]|nr:LysR substrate-binding domain-containing protein [Azospirillaceae bacterium]
MDLRHLRYFVAVAEELHFGRAAERLHIAQPPLSQQIKALETELGVRLFHRTKRRVDLTEAGRLFLDEACAVLARAERAVTTAQRAGRGELGRLAVGYTGSTAYNPLVPRIIRHFRESFPTVELTLQDMHTMEQAPALLEGRIDVGFCRPPVPDPDGLLSILPLLEEPLVAALPAAHPQAPAATVTLAGLAHDPFILYPRAIGPGLFDRIVAACREAGFSPRVTQQAPQFASIVGLVAAGLGVALVPTCLEQLRAQGVVYRPLADVHPTSPMAVAFRRGDRSPTAKAFVAVVREALKADTSNPALT